MAGAAIKITEIMISAAATAKPAGSAVTGITASAAITATPRIWGTCRKKF